MFNVSVPIPIFEDSPGLGTDDLIGGVFDLYFGDLSPLHTVPTPDESPISGIKKPRQVGTKKRATTTEGFVGNNDRCSLLKCVSPTSKKRDLVVLRQI